MRRTPSSGRIRVAPSAGLWTHTIDATAGGPGGGINRLGDMAGGAASWVSIDRWVAGDLYTKTGPYPAVWSPQ